MRQPKLYVIAGPNGSGKSTFSRALTLLDNVIDPDAELKSRCLQFPDVSSANLLEAMIDNWFPGIVKEAIEKRTDFAFETNFRDESVMKVVKQFQQAGFLTHLFFIGLPSLHTSVKRVMLRVSQGGHDVPNSDIEFNYEASRVNLDKHGTTFDKIWVFESSDYNKDLNLPILICKAQKDQLIEQSLYIPKWAKTFVQRLDRTQLNLKVRKSKGKRKGPSL